jgi:hypothetical protein
LSPSDRFASPYDDRPLTSAEIGGLDDDALRDALWTRLAPHVPELSRTFAERILPLALSEAHLFDVDHCQSGSYEKAHARSRLPAIDDELEYEEHDDERLELALAHPHLFAL